MVSQPFKASSGVKQGGVLSPILFTLYLDVLMDMLKSSEFGCYVGNVFLGALAYIVLLALSRFALGRLLKQCSIFLGYISLILMQIKVNLLFIAITKIFTVRKYTL